jgi:hypothetical protein
VVIPAESAPRQKNNGLATPTLIFRRQNDKAIFIPPQPWRRRGEGTLAFLASVDVDRFHRRHHRLPMMRAMIIWIPMQTAAAGVRRVAVSLPYIDFLSPTGRTSIHGRKHHSRQWFEQLFESFAGDYHFAVVSGAGHAIDRMPVVQERVRSVRGARLPVVQGFGGRRRPEIC